MTVSTQGPNERQDFSPMRVERDEQLLAALRGREPTAADTQLDDQGGLVATPGAQLDVMPNAERGHLIVRRLLTLIGALYLEDRAASHSAYAEIRALKDPLQSENIVLREEIDKTSMFEEIVGASPPLRTVLSHVSKVAPTDSTVLITGETGTGKELIARAIHKRSPRSARAFVAVNCAAIPSSLIVSELFGHEKGAFTGALQRRQGRFELADGGTIFLDEVGELPAAIQIMLLRVLQEHEFERVGGSGPVRVNIRVIAATNRDLHTAVADGTFRADLFYRLNVFPLDVPALRERRSDIPLLVEYFVHGYVKRLGKRIRSVTKETAKLLQSYDWPGNIRELQNVIERAVIVCDSDTLSIDARWLSGRTLRISAIAGSSIGTLATHEKDAIEAMLKECKGRVAGPFGAAAQLGVPASTLESKIKALKIEKRRFKPAHPPRVGPCPTFVGATPIEHVSSQG
jgi:transcriptional regulator with GAF, ATPase, and Fis domain